MSFGSSKHDFLRDPIWQLIGVVTGIAGLLISIFISYDIYRRTTSFSDLTIEENYFYNLAPYTDDKQVIGFIVNDKKIYDLYIYSFVIGNTGRNPILPSDYMEPIRVTIEEPWRLVAVEKSFSVPPEVAINWTEAMSNTFEMKPTLLNPSDRVGVSLFLINPALTTTKDVIVEKPTVNWTGRIVNIPSLRYKRSISPAEESGLGVIYSNPTQVVKARTSGAWGSRRSVAPGGLQRHQSPH